MTGTRPDPDDGLAAARRRDRACDAFEEAWAAGVRPRIEDALAGVESTDRDALFGELLRVELQFRRKRGEDPCPAEYAARFPTREPVIAEEFARTSGVEPSKSHPPGSGGRFAAGDTVAGRYRIVARVGAGGMGEVYRADDLELGESVALKFLPSARAADPGWIARLKQEVALARRVTHENVCRVHDLGDADGVPFLVMEYADGKSLEAVLRMVRRLTPEQVVGYARQLCDGLAAVHDRGLLHRDLKPGNVLLDADGKVLLADFGLAAAAADVGAEEVGAGTVLYMAPEQLAAAEVTARSDLFALGLILYELTTGERPFPGLTRAELLRQHAEGPPVRPADRVKDIDPDLDRVILRCLERDPGNRPASARAVKEALPPLSPKKTADEGGAGKLRPRVALALLAAALAGIFLNAALAPRTMAFQQVGPGKDPDYLRERAAELARSFGYADRVAMDAGSLEWDADLVRHATRQSPPAWPTDAASPPMYYWYRASPQPLVPTYRVTPADPPMNVPGMVCVMLDRQGRLIEFHAVAPREADGSPGANTELGAKLLEAAGLNSAEFRRMPPIRRPPVYADEAWSFQKGDGRGPRVDVGVCGGRPVYFRVSEPFGERDRPDRSEGDTVLSPRTRQALFGPYGLMILFAAVVLAIPVTLRNLRLGRCDVPMALRVGAVYLLLVLGGWVLTANHCSSLDSERLLLVNILGVGTFWCVMLLVMYLVLEPYMRRRWPKRLSSWNRLLVGRLGDPMVGRDVLVGVSLGVVVALVIKLVALARGTFVLIVPLFEAFTPSAPLGLLVALASLSMLRAVNGLGYLVLLGLALRRERLAQVVLAGIIALNFQTVLNTFDANSWITWAGCGLLGGIVVLTIARFGMVSTLTLHFTALVISSMPVTLSPEAWYSGLTVFSAGVLVALAVYGFFVSLGGQKLLPDNL